KKPSISLFTGIGLILGLSIGSGIFASPGPVLVRVGSGSTLPHATFALTSKRTNKGIAALGVWLASGLLVLMGCACYAELGSAFPGNGGEGLYLFHSYSFDPDANIENPYPGSNPIGSLLSFLFVYTNVLVARPCSLAVISSVFGEYIARLIPLSTAGSFAMILPRLIGAVLIWFLTALNISSNRLGALVQDVFTILKLVSLLLISVWGFVYLYDHPEYQEAHNFSEAAWRRTSTNLGDYAIAFYSALWAYDGWSNLNLVTGELKDPAKNLPKAILIGPSIVIIAYLLVNLSYYLILSSDIVGATKSIALDFGNHILGKTLSSILIPIIVLGSTFGAANASIFTGARVTTSAAARNQIPTLFAHFHSTLLTPAAALTLQAALASLYCAAATFEPLVTFYSNLAWFFYLAAVFGGVLLLRWTHAEDVRGRPFRVWGSVAVAFCVAAATLLGFSVYERPLEGALGLLFLTSGVGVWYVREYWDERFSRIYSKLCGMLGLENRWGTGGGGVWGRLNDTDENEMAMRRFDEEVMQEDDFLD
ncbi:amino acid/polyamine transporter I, partial [Chytriomyces sp. MP71]